MRIRWMPPQPTARRDPDTPRNRHGLVGTSPHRDCLAVLRYELAGGEGRASRIGKDGESHPRRILRLGEDRAPEVTRSRSDRVHVVDGEGHAPARWAALAGQDRRYDVLETLGCAHSLHPRAQAGVEFLEMIAVARQSP